MEQHTLEFRIQRTVEAKTRSFPVLFSVGDLHGVGQYADPTVQLIEAHIKAQSRAAVREYAESTGEPWPFNAEYEVSIALGLTTGGNNADADNLAKTILDGMTGVVFERDSRVVELHVERSRPKTFKRPTIDIGGERPPDPDETRVVVTTIRRGGRG